MRQLIDIKFKLGGGREQVKRYIEWFEFAKRRITYYLKKLDSKNLEALARNVAEQRFKDRNIRLMSPRMQKIMSKFYAETTKENKKLVINVGHKYLDGEDEEFSWKGKSKILGSAVLKMLDTGRKSYSIPKKYKAGKVLFWRYGHSVKIRYELGSTREDGTKRRGIFVNKFAGKERVLRAAGGMYFLRAIKSVVLEYVEGVQRDLKQSVNRKAQSI